MFLGVGEYIIISSCVKGHYNNKGLIFYISCLSKYGADIKEANLLKVLPAKVRYDLIWNDEVDSLTVSSLSEEDLKNYTMSSCDIMFNGRIPARLQVNFLDDMSYEVSLLFNYSALIDEEVSPDKTKTNAELVETLGIDLFREIKPIYGMISVERSVCGMNEISSDECLLPSDKAFYSQVIVDCAKDVIEPILQKSKYVKIIENVGIFFRKTEVDDFKLLEEESAVLSKIKKFL